MLTSVEHMICLNINSRIWTEAKTSLTAISKKKRGPAQTLHNHKHLTRAKSTKCTRCGQAHNNVDKYPARGKTCMYCRQLNYFSVVCRARIQIYYDKIPLPLQFSLPTGTPKTCCRILFYGIRCACLITSALSQS